MLDMTTRVPTTDDKKNFVTRAEALFNEGVDLPEASLKLAREFAGCFNRDQAARAAKDCYEWAARARIAIAKANTTDAAIKLYDSLIALGWAPPQ